MAILHIINCFKQVFSRNNWFFFGLENIKFIINKQILFSYISLDGNYFIFFCNLQKLQAEKNNYYNIYYYINIYQSKIMYMCIYFKLEQNIKLSINVAKIKYYVILINKQKYFYQNNQVINLEVYTKRNIFNNYYLIIYKQLSNNYLRGTQVIKLFFNYRFQIIIFQTINCKLHNTQQYIINIQIIQGHKVKQIIISINRFIYIQKKHFQIMFKIIIMAACCKVKYEMHFIVLKTFYASSAQDRRSKNQSN
eukprot:TRINITY_DN1266_c0_g1_i4.p5 TRINITY_DN1266_c0_g1~~TRINITY_DN1266_c0_g1_i4.p5  ORF type:complete len:251 (+),score=-12.92 TRINITY_DN1266_c0_g1_i4:1921-2673(+)